jgi:hypothetical protein
MIKILANNAGRKQYIFESYIEASERFDVTFSQIKRAIEKGSPIMTKYGAFWFDILEE